MKLSELLEPWIALPPEFDRSVEGLSIDSRRILPGEIFIALKGTQTDGQQFIHKALQFGANAIIVEGKIPGVIWHADMRVPLITLPQLTKTHGKIAARFFGDPSASLCVIGVTGTNGKTSVTHYIASILNGLNKPCGVMGTVGNGPLTHLQASPNTTLDAISIQRFLAAMRDQGLQAVAMEVSSHALDQDRVNGVKFAAGIFTNLSQDHLDYHQTMEAYANAKLKLFTEFSPPVMVLHDSIVIPEIAPAFAGVNSQLSGIHVYGLQSMTKNCEYSLGGIKARFYSQWGDGVINTPLLGEFNLSNILAAMTVLLGLGESLSEILNQLPHLKAVKGRMQLLTVPNRPSVVIDYAHSPDALEKVLKTLSIYKLGKLWCVFGCGGNRDTGKRPLMGEIAGQYADEIILTDDNCRAEDPITIVIDIVKGIPESKPYKIIHNRADAIKFALQEADKNDMILIAGKGHEEYQEINGQKLYFSDEEEVKKLCLNYH
jgi:UDP-N-acetylmuramoyl-L-alanyl-D-glutamate--2,6-diaminopimelate ligase